MMNFRKKLGKEILFFDGAFGTRLQELGLRPGECPENRNILTPELVYKIHKEYLEAGADIILANTFGANRLKLDGSFSVEEVIKAGVSIAKRAVADSGREAYVALDIGATGKLLKPYGDLEFESAYEVYSEMVKAGVEAGVDLISIETMTDIYETKAAILAVKENTDLPLTVTVSFDSSGKMLTGATPEIAATVIESLGADAVGINCGLGPMQCKPLLEEMAKSTLLPLAVSPNAGLPVLRDGKTVFELVPEEFALQMVQMVEAGASLLGGCCGTTPAHIKEAVKLCKGIKVIERVASMGDRTLVTSGVSAVSLGGKPRVIGERLNPTGKSKLKAALRSGDMEYVCAEAVAEEDNGAEILDVNAGLPDINEVETMKNMVSAVQSVCGLPLQIDTASAETLEAALRIYNGRPLINSVNGKKESLETVLPLVKKYGACVVALTLDENGIPDTAEGRIAIAERIVERAEAYGIPKKDILVDTLTMTVATGDNNANVTLSALEYVHQIMKMKTVLGVSNVSFGLPERESVTAGFLTLALHSGLSAAIINPSSALIMNTFYAYIALSGQDEKCVSYVSNARRVVASVAKTPEINTEKENSVGAGNSLGAAIIRGLSSSCISLTQSLLQSKEPLDIINGEIMPALNKVGEDFASGKAFLPQLLMSADAAKNSFEVIKEHMLSRGEARRARGGVILATVKGDVHDIGKNIVKILLENYGFEVVDLGKDVAPESVLDCVKNTGIRLIGLSALMTTTVGAMEKTISLLHTTCPECRIMVGGAVLTPEYAKAIGADHYCADAMESVRFAEQYYEGHSF